MNRKWKERMMMDSPPANETADQLAVWLRQAAARATREGLEAPTEEAITQAAQLLFSLSVRNGIEAGYGQGKVLSADGCRVLIDDAHRMLARRARKN